ncbi:baseplate J/gp47 family protein [Brevibacillus massiliensis]|uniref:baseplate J/gp47 family protein n=1 Tax=Brevibacillus massiliensis TaxID=1118054 RepID=UPI0002E7F71D|nr:baseplate J/gp47 family protein [Brevibacillus massiliensis]
MYEHMTYEYILQRMLSKVPNTVDKREGSLIYTACAAVAAEMAQMYADLDTNNNLSWVDTATGEYLTRKCAEFGVNREPATKAIRKGLFYDGQNNPFDVPIGSRFSIEDQNFVVTEKITTGEYKMECETTGATGNQLFGALLPIDYIQGLARAELADVLVPGEDEESDESLRDRFFKTVNEPTFGGNVADYMQMINAIEGVGGTKVFPTWQGGGTVKCTIIGADFNPPAQQLIDQVQTTVDPIVNQGQGLGMAPIGHRVTIAGVQGVTVNIVTTVTLAGGYTVEQVQAPIESVISNYLQGLREDWENQTNLIVRVALIDAEILTVPGVIDVANTTLNGAAFNIPLGEEEIPQMGTVTINV